MARYWENHAGNCTWQIEWPWNPTEAMLLDMLAFGSIFWSNAN